MTSSDRPGAQPLPLKLAALTPTSCRKGARHEMATPIHRRDQRAPHPAGPVRLVPQCADHDRTSPFRNAFRRTDALGVESRSDRRLRLGSLLALVRTRPSDNGRLDGRCFRGNSEGLRPAVSSFRSEEHTSELQSLMRISYAVFCLKKKMTLSYIII